MSAPPIAGAIAADPGRRARMRLAPGDLPDALARRYLAEPARYGGFIDYYLSPNAARAAFRDRGDRLSAQETAPETVATLVAIAVHRGWSRVRVTGSDEFRREVWMAGRAAGLVVHGHRPSAREHEALARRAETSAPPPSAAERAEGIEGVVLEIGSKAFRAGRPATAMVRLRTQDGRTLTLWGADLHAALARSGLGSGETVRLTQTPPDGPGRRAAWRAERVGQARSASAAIVTSVVRRLLDGKDAAALLARLGGEDREETEERSAGRTARARHERERKR